MMYDFYPTILLGIVFVDVVVGVILVYFLVGCETFRVLLG
jgi:hypothetical protein